MNKSTRATAGLPDELELAAMRQVSAQPVSSQRELAARLGISVGKTNFVLRALLEKGLVKVENFRRNDRKIGYLYRLTPSGVAEKARLMHTFLACKEAEYAHLLEQLVALKAELDREPASKGGSKASAPTAAS